MLAVAIFGTSRPLLGHEATPVLEARGGSGWCPLFACIRVAAAIGYGCEMSPFDPSRRRSDLL